MRRKKDIVVSVQELAEKLGGHVVGVSEGASVSLSCLNTLEEAGASDIALIASEKYLAKAEESQAGCFLVYEKTIVPNRPCVVVDHVWKSGLRLFDLWFPDEKPAAGVHPSAVVDSTARLGTGVSIGPLVVVEAGAEIGDGAEIGAQCFIGRDAKIGAGSLLYAGVRVMERVQVGRGVILHPGVVLGADGYSYEIIDFRAVKIPQVGTVVIEDDVEIGANTCVDRAFLRETRIGAGTKIDNLVQIAHNVQVGRMCGMASQVGIAGSTKIGDGCMFWGKAGIKDNITIGSRSEIMAYSAPQSDVPAGSRLLGIPAVPVMDQARIYAAQRQLPDMLKRLKKLEKMIEKEGAK